MAIAVIMPKQGQSVETCIITKWFKKKGEAVSAGDILFSYETDKAAFDLESPADGILLEKFYAEGDEVPVLENVAVLGKTGEVTEAYNPHSKTTTPVSEIPETAKPPETINQPEILKPSGNKEFTDDQAFPAGKIRISPRARRMAKEKQLNYSNIQGSGPNGRIIAKDIEAALKGADLTRGRILSESVEYTEAPLTNIRKLIAKTMHASLQNSAQLTHHMSADVRKLLEARLQIKSRISSGQKQQDITLNDMVCWCVIKALGKFPEVNSHYLDNVKRTFHKVHLGIAVDTPRGLMVPAVKNASEMDLVRLSAELKSVAESCKKGSINPELIQSTSATFTVSNLGNYGVEMFTPVINLPQTGILGVCTIINRPANLGNNTFGFVPYIGLSLTYDHRSIDGGPATLFLKEIKEQIENFSY